MPLDSSAEENRVLNKVLCRLVPYMMVLYWFNYLDRVNISVAKLRMNDDLGFNDAIFGTGMAIFYIGYFFFEVPSNIMLEKLGARVWIARIMISWGIVSALFMFVENKWGFYALRILLGITEAGYFPGMLLFLTYWFPARQRAKVGAIFMTSIALACAVGLPLSGWIMDSMNGVAGIKGWQWLFLLEGMATVALGISVYFVLTDRPAQALWLNEDERKWLSEHIDTEHSRTKAGHGQHRLMDGMNNPRVWLLSLIYIALMFGFYGIIYWTPTIIKEVHKKQFNIELTAAHTAALSAIPYICAGIAMVLIGRMCDRSGNRRGTVIAGMIAGAAGLLATSFTESTALTIVSLSIAAIGILGSLSPFWSLPPAFLTGTAAATGIAFINSWGNLGGGYGSSELMGWLKTRYQSYAYGLWIDAGMLLLGAALVYLLQPTPKPISEPSLAHA